MLRRLPGAISNVDSLKTAASSSQTETPKEQKNDTVNVHGMWYQPSPLPRVTSRDQHFREKLIASYVSMTNGAMDLPSNVTAHLWTDRKSMHAFYMPIAKSNGAEIELPHSMLAKAPLSVHLEEDIEKMIAKVPNKMLRTMFEELHNHPAAENIGLRSDLARLLYGILYFKDVDKTRSGHASEINMHIDIDALAAITSEKAARQLGQRNVNQLSGLQRAKLELQAMHKSLANMKFPKKTTPLSKEEVAALADRPQKSWSVHAPVEKSAGEPIPISNSVLNQGYLTDGVENDMLAMVPGRPQAVMVARQTQHLLKTGKYNKQILDIQFRAQQQKRFPSYPYDKPIQEAAELFHTLNGGVDMPAAQTLDQQRVLDYFRQAEKIRQMRPALQEKVDALTIAAQDETRTEQERDKAKMRIEALSAIYDAASMLVESFVNKNTFSPQVMVTSKDASVRAQGFFNSVFNMKKQSVFTSSWKGGELKSDESNTYDSPEYKVQEKLVFKEIKALIRFSLDE